MNFYFTSHIQLWFIHNIRKVYHEIKIFQLTFFQIGKKMLMYSAQSNMKKVSLELGGKSPLVIFDDADGKAQSEG